MQEGVPAEAHGRDREELTGSDAPSDRPQEHELHERPFEPGELQSAPSTTPTAYTEAMDTDTLAKEREASESAEAGPSLRAAASKKPEEVLLKNRKAQRRFRERQKSKISELEDKNTELAAELKRLQQENHNLDARMTALVRLVHQRNAQLDDLRAGQAAGALDEEAYAAFTDDLVLSWSEGQTFALTPDQVRRLSREDLTKIWKEYVQQLAVCLGDMATLPNVHSPTLETIKRLTHELTMILLRVSICSPVVSRSFAAFRLEEPNMPEDDSESTWRSIVSTLMLTLEQRAELVQLRQLYLSKLHVIMDQRREALKSMHESMLVLPLAAGERISAVQYLKAHDAGSLLRQSLREEHALKLDFLSTVLKHLLSPLQVARCLVQSYPWFPDTLALTTWLAAEAGDPQALAFFGPAGRSTFGLMPAAPTLQLSVSPRAGSGYSTPRNTTPQTPPLTQADPTPFQMGQPLSPSGASWGVGGPSLRTQHSSGHSGASAAGLPGVQFGISPRASPLYAQHSPSPVVSPPLSPSHALQPGVRPSQKQLPPPQ